MGFFVALPLPARLAILALLGLMMGVICNQKIYRWAFHARAIDPWGDPPPNAPPRVWSDHLPIVGWWGLAREWELHGPGFWIRPMVIELALMVGVPALYWWEIQGGLFPAALPANALQSDIVHAQFLAHLCLLPWLVIASFIDFDEQTIPWQVTLFGSLIAFLLAAVVPTSLLPDPAISGNGGFDMQSLLLTSPAPNDQNGVPFFGTPWPTWLNEWTGLALGLAGWAAWCLFERSPLLTFRRGVGKAVVYWCVTLYRHPGSAWFFLILLGGAAGVVATWWMQPPFWQGLLTAIVGAVVGASATWVLRLISNTVLGVDALGYGDVTLMATVGAFLGWQGALIALGMGPVLGIAFAIANAVINRRADICFGPFLCAGALIEIVGWRWIWGDHLRWRFQTAIGEWPVTVGLIVVMLGLFAVLLPVTRWLRQRILPDVVEG